MVYIKIRMTYIKAIYFGNVLKIVRLYNSEWYNLNSSKY